MEAVGATGATGARAPHLRTDSWRARLSMSMRSAATSDGGCGNGAFRAESWRAGTDTSALDVSRSMQSSVMVVSRFLTSFLVMTG